MWQSVEVNGKPCDVFESAGGTGLPGAVLCVQGAGDGGVFDQAMLGEHLGRRGLPALCPAGARSWWLDRVEADFDGQLTPEQFLVECAVAAMADHWNVAPPKIALLGIGTGGQAVLRICFKNPRRFPVAAALLPRIDFHQLYGRGTALDAMFTSKEAARQETAILHVHALNRPRHLFFAADPSDQLWFDGARRLHEKLSAIGVPHTAELDRSARSAQAYLADMLPGAVDFLAEGLADEALPTTL